MRAFQVTAKKAQSGVLLPGLQTTHAIHLLGFLFSTARKSKDGLRVRKGKMPEVVQKAPFIPTASFLSHGLDSTSVVPL